MAQYDPDLQNHLPPGDPNSIFDPNNLAGNNLSLQQPKPGASVLPVYQDASGLTPGQAGFDASTAQFVFPQAPSGVGGFGGGAGSVPTGGFGSAPPAATTTTPSILGTVGKVGTALSSIAGGLQQGRQQQTVDQQNQDRNQITAAQVNLGAPNTRMGSAVRGDILSNAKDFSYGAPTMVGNIPVPSSTGGLRPSIFSPQTKALGSLVSSQALTNETADGGNPVKLTPIPQASTGANILGTAGIFSQFAGLLSPYLRPKTPPPIPNVGGFE